MDIVKVFGNNLRKYRNELGLSQEAFAEKCGLHRTYISAIECYRRSIALENVQRIAAVSYTHLSCPENGRVCKTRSMSVDSMSYWDWQFSRIASLMLWTVHIFIPFLSR